MPSTGPRRTSRPAPFNAPLAAIAGILLGAADAFLHPLIILPLFALQVRASIHTIALISAAGVTSWFVALVCASIGVRLLPRQQVATTVTSIVGAAAIAWLAYETHGAGRSDAGRLRLFFFCYVIYSVARGLNRAPYARRLTGVLRGNRAHRSNWLAVVGIGLLTIAAGFVARSALGSKGPGFPTSFALIFGCAAAALAAAAFFLAKVREPWRSDDELPSASDLSIGVSNALASPLMRRFLIFRLTMALLAGADPFFIVFAIESLKTPLSMAGVYLAIYGAGFLLSTPLWNGLIDRAGNRIALQLVAAVRIVAPLVALALPDVVSSKLYVDHIHNPRMPFYIFAIVFGALGVAARGQMSGDSNYLAEIAPTRHFDAYAFVANVSVLIAGFTPLIAVWIIERDGFQRLFLSTAIAGIAAVLLSGLLGETRARMRATARALRPRGARSA
jgi:hypothetical protein